VLVDFENVQPKDLASINGGAYQIKIFLGAQQAKIPLAVASTLQAFGQHAEYIQINGNGSNAVDFHIAYYIGRLAATASDTQFYVISKDTGFDPLLKHLKDCGISCQRSTSIADVVSVKRSAALNGDRVSAILENLAKRKSAKPRTLKTLRTTIKAHFSNELMEGELDRLIEQLITRGAIRITDGKVEYESKA
jgi:PIN domain-containing protein